MRTPAAADPFLTGLVAKLFANARTDGPPARLGRMTVISDPPHIDRVARNPDLFQKNFALISALGISRFNSNGEEWAIRRNLTQPHYLAAAKPANRPFVYQTYSRRLQAAEPDVFAVQRALFSASAFIFHSALGCDLPIGDVEGLIEAARDLVRRLQFHSWMGSVYPDRRAIDIDTEETLARFRTMVDANSPIGELLQTFAAQATGVARFVALEEYVMNLFAGIETAVATICWAIDRLGTDEEAQQRIYREVSLESGEQPYFDCFVNETMRYFPAIPFLTREVVAETDLGDTQLQAGDLILLSTVGAHHNSKYWQEPHIFDFSRREFMAGSYDRRSFVPFFVGQRMCGGARLALMEVREAIRAIVQQFRVERRGDGVRFTYALALRPDNWSAISLTRR
ncbi:MAG: cytochrome P450 [Bauldia sp.]